MDEGLQVFKSESFSISNPSQYLVKVYFILYLIKNIFRCQGSEQPFHRQDGQFGGCSDFILGLSHLLCISLMWQIPSNLKQVFHMEKLVCVAWPLITSENKIISQKKLWQKFYPAWAPSFSNDMVSTRDTEISIHIRSPKTPVLPKFQERLQVNETVIETYTKMGYSRFFLFNWHC